MIYVLVFFTSILLSSAMGGSKLFGNRKIYKNTYLFVLFAILLLMGLRHFMVGTDTVTYVSVFIGDKDERTILEVFKKEPEPFYALLLILCQKITSSYTIFLLVFALPLSIGFALFLKDHSEDYFLSVLVYSVLGILYFSMAGLRQALAMGFLLIAFRFAYKRKFLPFLLLCLVASGFHNTSLIFILVYPLFRFKISWGAWILVAVALLLGVTRSSIILRLVGFLLEGEKYEYYFDGTVESSLTLTLFFIQTLFLAFCYLFKKQVLKKDPKASIFYNMAIIGLIFQAFTPIRGEFFRVSLYFSVSLCVLIPKALMAITDKRVQSVAYFVISACCLAYIFLPGSWVYTYQLFI